MAAECGGVQFIELDYIYTHTHIYIYLWLRRRRLGMAAECGGVQLIELERTAMLRRPWLVRPREVQNVRDGPAAGGVRVGLHTLLPLPILYGIYYNNKGWCWGNTVLRNSVGDEGGWGAQTKGVFANSRIRVINP